MSLCLFFSGFHNASLVVNPQDLAPKHAGSVFGMMNAVGSIPGTKKTCSAPSSCPCYLKRLSLWRFCRSLHNWIYLGRYEELVGCLPVDCNPQRLWSVHILRVWQRSSYHAINCFSGCINTIIHFRHIFQTCEIQYERFYFPLGTWSKLSEDVWFICTKFGTHKRPPYTTSCTAGTRIVPVPAINLVRKVLWTGINTEKIPLFLNNQQKDRRIVLA